jgi:anaerobic ribonucleoside-triphosphate reductase
MTAEERKIVENKISELKKEMKDIHGSKCEVYSRVVGYLRPVQNWN